MMKTPKIIEDEGFVHNEHREWISRLDFYEDEIKFFQKELIKIVNEHNFEFSSLESVEEYREILHKKLKHIEELRQLIHQHEKLLARPPEMDEAELIKHQAVRDKYNDFVEGFEMMKKTFKRYAAYND